MQLPRVFTPARGTSRHTQGEESGHASEHVATLALAGLTLLYAVWTALGDHPEQAAIAGALGLTLCLVARQIQALRDNTRRLD